MNIEQIPFSRRVFLPQQNTQAISLQPKTKLQLHELSSFKSLDIHQKEFSTFFTCIKEFFQILCLPFLRLYNLLFPSSSPKETVLEAQTPLNLEDCEKITDEGLEKLAEPVNIVPKETPVDIGKEACFSSLQDAYEIARYIHTFYSEINHLNKPYANISRYFKTGPNPGYSQLQQGLVLVADGTGDLTQIDTPIGRWMILAQTIRYSIDFGEDGRVAKIFKEIEKSLKLVKMPRSEVRKGYHHFIGRHDQFYAVTEWNGKQIPPPVYQSKANFVPYQDAKKIWETFASTHADLA